MENVKRINKMLEETYGLSTDNKPKFRVAWSEDLLETRKGLFNPFAVFWSQAEIRRVPKYSYIDSRWVLEVNTHAFPEVFSKAIEAAKDVVMEGDGYEPLKVFITKKGAYLKPDLEICKLVCDEWVKLVNRPEAQRLTAKVASYNDVVKMKEESAKFFEVLNGDDSEMSRSFGKNSNSASVIIHRP